MSRGRRLGGQRGDGKGGEGRDGGVVGGFGTRRV